MPEMYNVFQKFIRMKPGLDPRFSYNFLGVKTRKAFVESDSGNPSPASPLTATLSKDDLIPVNYPAYDEEYWEWIDLLESVVAAKKKFVMMELGAGYGRWLINGALAVRQYHGAEFPVYLVGVEAEPTHFEWMKQHFLDNGLDPSAHRLVQNALDNQHHEVEFYIKHPTLKGAADWYGQAIARKRIFSATRFGTIRMNTVTLRDLLGELEYVNLIDIDLQGKEYDVVKDSIDGLCEKARRLHIGTHGFLIEWKLRRLFKKHGWKCAADFRRGKKAATQYGEMLFEDGVQSWVNPVFIEASCE